MTRTVPILLLALSLVLACSGRRTEPAPPPTDDRPEPAEEHAEPEPDPEQEEPSQPESDNPLYLSPADIDFEQNPGLLTRLRATPHNYFRFIGQPFAEQVCERFQDRAMEMPNVNLHGDAHLEQYAVTDLGRGLTDYDLATTGPAVIDLVRVGTSVALGCAQHSFELGTAERAGRALLEGYIAGLQAGPTSIPEEPEEVERIRGGFDKSRADLHRYAAELMVPLLSEEERAQAESDFAGYARQQRQLHPELPEHFFRIKAIGRLRLGIGSALDIKYLLRVEGATEAEEDDEILEAKEVRSLSGIPCILSGRTVDPFRILVAQSRIAYQPFPYLGFVRAGDVMFWLKAWTPNYYELAVGTGLQSPDTLVEIARDIGHQLGRGHVNQIADPHGAELRAEQLAFVQERRAELEEAILQLTTTSLEAWQEFVAASADHPRLDDDGEIDVETPMERHRRHTLAREIQP